MVDLRQTMTPEQWREFYMVVLTAAHRITRSRPAARELTHAALERLMTTRPWNPAGKTTLEQHTYGILKSLFWAARTSKRPDYEGRAGVEQALISEAGRSTEEMSLDRAEREGQEAVAAARVGKLRTRLAGHTLELLVLDVMEAKGIKKPAALALRTRKPVGEINAAVARIRRYMKSILAAERGEDEEVV